MLIFRTKLLHRQDASIQHVDIWKHAVNLFIFRTKLLHRQDASIILVDPWKDAINMFADTDLLGKWHHLYCF